MPFDTDEWHEWRGAIDERMKSQSEQLSDHCERLDSVEEKVGAVLVKLAVPLFLVGIAGPVIGAVIVVLLTNALKH